MPLNPCPAVASDPNGQEVKFVAYGREYLDDYFGLGRDGIKFNVFTTGPYLSDEEAQAIYNDGFRGEASQEQPGTGHGLAFVKQVVEIHGGVVGYERTPLGNNFYFILPYSDGADRLTIELLAPGGPASEAFEAAVTAGAGAVSIGAPKANARACGATTSARRSWPP
ncbi:MAG: hypothetical protein U5J62_10390 [Desulfurivibrio sp.]|nr:hypothetical protein [Desulfurivibrio sp.]